jgi:hypothetical protein
MSYFVKLLLFLHIYIYIYIYRKIFLILGYYKKIAILNISRLIWKDSIGLLIKLSSVLDPVEIEN